MPYMWIFFLARLHIIHRPRLDLYYIVTRICKKNSQNLGNDTILSFSQTQFVNMCGLNKSTLLLKHIPTRILSSSTFIIGFIFSHIYIRYNVESYIEKISLFFIPWLDILFLSNHNIHKSFYGFCIWASDPLIDRIY